MMIRKVTIKADRFAIDGVFRISRDASTFVDVVYLEIEQDGVKGHAECRPYARYDETVASVSAQLQTIVPTLQAQSDFPVANELLPAGAARNALDCALWDLKCKLEQKSIWTLLDLDKPTQIETAFTLGLDTPEAMAAKATKNSKAGLLKIKLGSGGDADMERLAAIRSARSDARLIVDANEGWTGSLLDSMISACTAAKVDIIEQPLPASDDSELAHIQSPIPLCADESLHTTDDIAALSDRYQAINIKLDKSGGLTEALKMVEVGRRYGMKIMSGCMLASSLSMAPAFVIASLADIVDLDGPLLLAEDRPAAIKYDGTFMNCPQKALWG